MGNKMKKRRINEYHRLERVAYEFMIMKSDGKEYTQVKKKMAEIAEDLKTNYNYDVEED